jgi:glycosyltransferase involved in cell wall biosynthesis
MSFRMLGWTGDMGACRFYRLDEPMRAMGERFGYEYTVTNSPDPEMPLNVIGTQRIWEQTTLLLWQALDADGRVGMVYDMDDDLWNVPDDNPAYHYFANPALQDGLREHMQYGHTITVSTPYLAGRIAEEVPNAEGRILVVPNTVPAALLTHPTNAGRHWPLTIGWTGSATHQRDWDDATPHVNRALQRAGSNARLVTAGYKPHKLKVSEHLMWTRDITEHYARLATFDIGLAPLHPGVFNRSKSHIKALEMMALGVPVIASDSEAYRDLIVHGVNGFLVTRPYEWTGYLSGLINDPDLRARMGAEARQTASEYTSEQLAPVWNGIYVDAWKEARGADQ